jgi:outer membrane protein, multidrug efflux system
VSLWGPRRTLRKVRPLVSRLPLFGVLASAALAGACAVAPVTPRADLAVPAQWTEQLPADESVPQTKLTGWWRQFNDPALDGIVARATSRNLDVREAIARLREVRAGVAVAESARLPQLGAATAVNRARTSEQGRLPAVPGRNPNTLYQPEFDASWELDLFGAIRSNVAAAQSDFAESAFARDAVQTSVAAEAVRQYVALRANQSRLDIRRQQHALLEDTVKLTNARFQAGLTSQVDEWRARELRSSIAAESDALSAEIRAGVYRLAVLCGEPPAGLISELSPAAPMPSSSALLPATVPADVLTRRLDLRQAEQAVVGADARRRTAAADAYPRITLLGNVGLAALTTSALTGGGSLFWAVGPSLTWPIFTGGRVRANIEAADARLEQAHIRYEKAVLTALADVEEAAARLAQERIRRSNLTDAIVADQTALSLAEERYTRGLTDFLPVLDAQRQLYSLQDQQIASERDVSIYLIALYKALGGGV